jgi:hypothetical protein
VTLLGEHPRDRQPDPAGGPGHDRRAVGHRCNPIMRGPVVAPHIRTAPGRLDPARTHGDDH